MKRLKILALAIIAMVACAVVSMIPMDDGDVAADGSSDSAQSYSFYLINTVADEDSTINGLYTATGDSPVDALCNALDAEGIAHTFTNTDASVYFGNKAIGDWTASWGADGYYMGNNYAIWNYNEENGWFTGNTFGMDSDTVYIISHEKYIDIDGPVATAYGIDNSKAWGDPADYDLVYDGVTGGYADAKMALVVWYKNSYGYGDPADYGISLKEGSDEEDVSTAALSWMGSFKNEYTAVAGTDCSGSGWGYAQLAPRDLKAAPAGVEFGLEAYPSVVKYVIGDSTKTVVHAIGDKTPYTPEVGDGYEFEGWYATSDYSGSRITEIDGDATLYAKIEAKPTQSYSFYLINTVAGEDSTINGWYYATGYSAVDALCNALDAKGIAHTFTNSEASVFFGNKAISDWTTSWGADGYYMGNNYAIWNYNEENGWFTGNTFGMDSDTVYIISHEKYIDIDGPVATAYGIDNSKAWGDPADYDLVYDGVTGGYADAKMALVVWYKNSYGYGDPADYGISLKEGSDEEDVSTAALSWMGSFKNEYTAVAGTDCSGSGWGYAQLAPRDLKAAPAGVEFGLEAYPSVVKYVIGDSTKTVVHAIGDKTPYTPEVGDGYEFEGWYATSDYSGSRITEIDGDATLYAKITQIAKTYTVEFDSNGGSGDMADVSGISGTYTLPECAFTAPQGKMFDAWSLSATGSAISGSSIEVASDVTLYALWKDAPTFTVTFRANGGSGSMSDETVISGTYTLPECAFTAPQGKIFDAWSLSASGPAISGSSIEVTANVTIYALWKDGGGGGEDEGYYFSGDLMSSLSESIGISDGNYKVGWTLDGAMGYAISGDYAYVFTKDGKLSKVSLDDGRVIKSVATAATTSVWPAVNGELVLDPKTGNVYDLDLNQKYAINATSDQAYYNDGYWYIVQRNKTCMCFSAVDEDPSSPTNVQEAKWSSTFVFYIDSFTLSVSLAFGDKALYYPGIGQDDNTKRILYSVDKATGAQLDAFEMTEIRSTMWNGGFISYADGTVYVSTHWDNMFGALGDGTKPVFVKVPVKSDGTFDGDSVKYICNGVDNSYSSKMVKVGDLGFAQTGRSFMVFDLKNDCKVIAKTDVDTRLSKTYSNIAVASGSDDLVYGYVSPAGIPMSYATAMDGLICFEYRISTNEIRTFDLKVGADETNTTFGVKIGPNGEVLFMKSNSTLYCITQAVKTYTVEFDLNGGKWDLENTIVAESGTYTVPTDTPTRGGYVFKGWKCGNDTVLPGESIELGSDVTLKAVWTFNIIPVIPDDDFEPIEIVVENTPEPPSEDNGKTILAIAIIIVIIAELAILAVSRK